MATYHTIEIDGYTFHLHYGIGWPREDGWEDAGGVCFSPLRVKDTKSPHFYAALNKAVKKFWDIQLINFKEGEVNDLEYWKDMKPMERDALQYRLRMGFAELEEAFERGLIDDTEHFLQIEEWVKSALEEPIEEGFVYIVKGLNGPETYYKIGRTIDPNSRITTFKNAFPFTVDFVIVIKSENYKKLETKLHRQFADKRVDGEWFNLSPFDLHYLRAEYHSNLVEVMP